MIELTDIGRAGDWWATRIPEACTILGVKVLWWARIAKITGLLGGVLIVLDLVGAERIGALADSGQRTTKQIITGGFELVASLRNLASIIVLPLGLAWGLYSFGADMAASFSPAGTQWVEAHKHWHGWYLQGIVYLTGFPPVIWLLAVAFLSIVRFPLWWLSKPYVAATFRVFAGCMLILGFGMDMVVN